MGWWLGVYPLGQTDSAVRLADPPLELTSAAALLADARTGAILLEHNADQRLFPASTTKVMTALLILEAGPRIRTARASAHAASTGESSIWLTEGEEISLDHLLASIIIKSANDACVAAAEALAGSEEAFVRRMNERARELGAWDTHFVNAHGLHDPEHYTTARDLLKITRAALRFPRFRRLCAERERYIPWPAQSCQRKLVNRNQLLWKYEECDGIKTGYTREAGWCLIGSATRDGWQLISVVLKSPSSTARWEESEKLLRYGFDHFQRLTVLRRGDIVGWVPVRHGEAAAVPAVATRDLVLVVPRAEPRPQWRKEWPTFLEAPVVRNELIGVVVGAAQGHAERVILAAGEDVARHWVAQAWSPPQALGWTLGLLWVGRMIRGASAKNPRRRRPGLPAQGRRDDPRRPGERGWSDRSRGGDPGRSGRG